MFSLLSLNRRTNNGINNIFVTITMNNLAKLLIVLFKFVSCNIPFLVFLFTFFGSAHWISILEALYLWHHNSIVCIIKNREGVSFTKLSFPLSLLSNFFLLPFFFYIVFTNLYWTFFLLYLPRVYFIILFSFIPDLMSWISVYFHS